MSMHVVLYFKANLSLVENIKSQHNYMHGSYWLRLHRFCQDSYRNNMLRSALILYFEADFQPSRFLGNHNLRRNSMRYGIPLGRDKIINKK